MKLTLTLSLAVLLLAACTDSADKTDDYLRQAEMAIAQGDMRVASSVADHIVGDKNLSGLTPGQLGRLSIIYMQLADSIDQQEHVSAAASCYRKAFECDSDSAAAFYSSLPAEHTSHAMMLSSLVRSLDHPDDSVIPGFEGCGIDSLPTTDNHESR